MRKPPLTIETFVAALAVLGIGASAGCSKAEQAAPDRATSSQGAKNAPATSAAAAPAAAPAPAPVASSPVDAGASDAKGVHASCGAGGCSADMKKKAN